MQQQKLHELLFQNKIPEISNFVKKTGYNTKVTETEEKQKNY